MAAKAVGELQWPAGAVTAAVLPGPSPSGLEASTRPRERITYPYTPMPSGLPSPSESGLLYLGVDKDGSGLRTPCEQQDSASDRTTRDVKRR